MNDTSERPDEGVQAHLDSLSEQVRFLRSELEIAERSSQRNASLQMEESARVRELGVDRRAIVALLSHLDFWESQGHSTVTIKGLRLHFTTAASR